MVVNIVILFILCFATSEKWLPPIVQVSSHLRGGRIELKSAVDDQWADS